MQKKVPNISAVDYVSQIIKFAMFHHVLFDIPMSTLKKT